MTEYTPTNKPSEADGTAESLSQALLMNFTAALDEIPPWWSKTRDNWMYAFWKKEGNDLLAGAVSTLLAKIAATNWYIEGPEAIATMYRDILLHQSDWGAGWDSMISKWVLDYLARDCGGALARHRTRPGDLTGPSLGFSYIDASKLYLTGDPDFPLAYDAGSKMRKLRREYVMRLVDTPSGREKDRGAGFCSVSRAISTATILRMIVKYKIERLSDLPPAAILFLSNLTEPQWKDIVEKYDARQHRQGNTIWRDLLVAFGHDPEHPVNHDLLALSSLPEHYDEDTATRIAVYTFALAFRVDPREYWPVSAGPLGTATEAEIQHKKAKAKGEGIIFNAIEHQLNHPLSLPSVIKFRFDYRDDEEDMTAAQIDKLKIDNIWKMWSPVQSAGQVPQGTGRPDKESEGDPMRALSESESGGLIDREEARFLLAQEGIIPRSWITGIDRDLGRFYDVRTWGPAARVYRDGTVV